MKKNQIPIYSLPKNMQSTMGNGYPTQKEKLQKSILTLHRKPYTNKYHMLER